MNYGVECDEVLIAQFIHKSDAERFVRAVKEDFSDCKFKIVKL